MSKYAHGLSVVMIAKDSERYLSLVLRSLWQIADEIVLVDTGSTDKTIEIAEKWNCRVFRFAWRDDFSEAKNHALEQARFSWIMSVDTDEVLFDRKAKDVLAGALRADAVHAYSIWLDNLDDSGTVKRHEALRLFRNDPLIRFTNPVHEDIAESLYLHWPGFVPPALELHLRHYGYLHGNRDGKHERNCAILRRWVAGDPDNIYACYKLGGTLANMGAREEALFYLERAFGLLERSLERASYPFLGACVISYCGLLENEGFADRAAQCRQLAAAWP
ncbi:MAG TPA: glycosyltransferase [Geobacteraceae bacterium]|nr:glycosyltransferase [Geobacteraceae bacterium]